MAKMNLTPLSEVVDRIWGPVGTPERDEMEAQLKSDLDAYKLGEAIKQARQSQNLTQEQLGDRLGVHKSQISKMERGRSIMTLPTISRVFRALGADSASLDLGAMGRIALW